MTTHAKPPIPILSSTASRERPALVVFCHLRWGFVLQRPQHLLTRLARQFDVVFVEEPVFDTAAPHLALSRPADGVDVLTPHTPHAAPGFHDDQLPTIVALLEAFMKARNIRSPLAWLYTPMALPLVDALAPSALVYDCMD